MKRLVLILLLHLVAYGCDYSQHKIKGKARVQSNSSNTEVKETPSLPGAVTTGASVNSLRLTTEALKRSLSSAFEIPERELCHEANGKDCFDDVHIMALGGNLPEKTGRFEALGEPSILSSISLERVAIITCHNMVAREISLGAKKKVFQGVDLGAKIYSTIELQTALSKSLLGRTLSSKESDVLSELKGTLVASEYAEIVCITMVSSTSFLFQ